ncbi:MAG: HEAT repeat domain-containing protein [Oscillochloridaceae bacterium umkhey_bin13]
MLSATHFPLLAGGRALQRYRAVMQAQLAAEPALQLLTALTSLPLGIAPFPDPGAILAQRTPLALCGEPGSGRSLALIQTAARWAGQGGAVPVLYLALADDDLPHQAPRAVVAAVAERMGLGATLVASERPLLLLLDDWELLAADRRMLWKHFMAGEHGTWPGLQVVAALPPSAKSWPGMQSVSLTRPNLEQVNAWLAHLLPERDLTPIMTALEHGALQHLLGYGLGDLVLLALTYPINGLPSSRAQLYEHAYVLAQPLLDQLRHREPGQPGQPGLSSQPGVIHLGRAMLRHERVARALAGGADLATLANLEPIERRAVAPLVAGLLDDPSPVFEALWKTIEEPASRDALIACLHDAPSRTPWVGLQLVEYLTAQATASALLPELEPVLPDLLAAAAQHDLPRALTNFEAVANHLPGLSRPWLALLNHPMTPPALRWAVAAWLVANPPPFAQVQRALDDAPASSYAAFAYLVARAYPTEYAHLQTTPLANGLQQLFHDPTNVTARRAVVSALLNNEALTNELRELAVAALDANELDLETLLAANPVVRQAAHTALHKAAFDTRLSLLGQVLVSPAASFAAQAEALASLAQLQHPSAAGLLVRTVLNPDHGLPIRLYATDLLVQQGPAGHVLLQRIIQTKTLPVSLRSTAVGHLGRLGIAAALPALAQLLHTAPEALLQRTAATALGAMAQQPALREPAVQALTRSLRQSTTDPLLAERLIRALGCSGSPRALTALAALLEPQLATLLQRAWLALAPALAHTPADAWPQLELPAPIQLGLSEAMAEGTTMADPPSHLLELVKRQALRLARAAAAGLADLAATPSLYPVVLRMLREVTPAERRPEVARALLDALARISPPADTLAELLDQPAADPSLIWLALERLGSDPDATALLVKRLAAANDPPFVQAQMIMIVGASQAEAAVPTLRRLASTPDYDLQVRQQAMRALGQINDLLARAGLAALVVSPELPTELRISAVASLPLPLSHDERTLLRQSLRNERAVPGLASGLARLLALSGDHEARSLVLADAQSESEAPALDGIATLAQLDDPALTPVLVQISQNPARPPNIRLGAVTALLQLDYLSYGKLLNDYLHAPAAAVRLQAHAVLARQQPDDLRLSAPLNDSTAPLVLRLHALGHLALHNPDDPLLSELMTTPTTPAPLRLAAAQALAAATQPYNVTALVAALSTPLPEQQPLPPLLRYQYLASLGRIAQRDSHAALAARLHLARLAEDPTQAVEHRYWAASQLLGC